MKNLPFAIFAAFLAFSFFSCSEEEDDDYGKFDKSEFNSMRQAWQDLELSNYSFEYEFFNTTILYSSFGSQIVKSKVSNGSGSVSESSFTNKDAIGNVEAPPKDTLKFYKTIDEIFDDILASYDNFQKTVEESHFIAVECEYDSEFHYPKKMILTSVSKKSNGNVGDWATLYCLNITDFAKCDFKVLQ